MPIRIELHDYTPPSLNRIGSRGSWRVWHREKKELQDMIGLLLLREVSPKRKLGTPVIMDATLWFPQQRNRDEGNYRSLLEKSAGDALVSGGWIPDDTPEGFRFQKITFLKGHPLTVLLLREGWNELTATSAPRERPSNGSVGPLPTRAVPKRRGGGNAG
jgi:hypothetical protein